MARYIDADKLKGLLRLDQAGAKNTVTHQSEGLHPIRIMQLKCFIGDIEYCLSEINEAPTADVVEVVRCKDCIYKTVTKDGEYNPEDIVCEYHMSDGFDSDDYCSFGKRKVD